LRRLLPLTLAALALAPASVLAATRHELGRLRGGIAPQRGGRRRVRRLCSRALADLARQHDRGDPCPSRSTTTRATSPSPRRARYQRRSRARVRHRVGHLLGSRRQLRRARSMVDDAVTGVRIERSPIFSAVNPIALGHRIERRHRPAAEPQGRTAPAQRQPPGNRHGDGRLAPWMSTAATRPGRTRPGSSGRQRRAAAASRSCRARSWRPAAR